MMDYTFAKLNEQKLHPFYNRGVTTKDKSANALNLKRKMRECSFLPRNFPYTISYQILIIQKRRKRVRQYFVIKKQKK